MKELRDEIDKIDVQIVSLFNQRMEIAGQIALEKQKNGLPVENSAREAEVLANVASMAEQKEYCKKVYHTILEVSKEYQRELIK